MESKLSIQQAAKKLGLTPYTLRYYDKEGLVPQLNRDKSGARVYSEQDVQWLELICCLKNSGMPLKDIREFMELCLQGQKTCEERREMLQKHRENIMCKIKELECSLCVVDYKIAHYKEVGIFHIDDRKQNKER